MEVEAAAAIVALLGVLVTFVFNIRSNRLTREKLEQDRRLAREAMEQDRRLREAAAARAEAAARLMERYSQRVVDALERIAERGATAAVFAEPTRGVRWSLDHHDGDRYRLVNTGDETAHDVEIRTDETLPMGEVEGGRDLEPHEALTFTCIRDPSTRDSTVTVTWHRAGDEARQTWQYPLPPRE